MKLKITIEVVDDKKKYEPMIVEREVARYPQLEVHNYPAKIEVGGKTLYGVTGGSLSVMWDQNPEYK